MSLFRKSLPATAGRVLATGCQFLTMVLVAAFLGARVQGNYAFLLLIPLLASNVLDAGLSQANMYLVGKGRFPASTLMMGALYWSAFWGLLAVGLWLVATLVRPSLLTLSFLRPFQSSPGLLGASVAAIGLTLFYNLVVLSYLARERIGLFNAFLVGRAAATLVLVGLALLLFSVRLRGVFALWTLSLIISAALLFIREFLGERSNGQAGCHPQAKLGSAPSARQLGQYYREALRYGLKLHLGSLCILLMYRLDHLLVMHFRGSADLGRYHLATLVAESLLFITGPMYLLAIPRTARGGARLANQETPRSFRVVLWAFLLGALPLYGLFRLVLALLVWRGYDAGHAADAFALLLPGVIFLGLDQILSGDLAGRGKQIWNTVVASGMLVVNIGLDLWWIPRYGIRGAAAATSVAYVAGCLITLGIFLRVTGVSWKALWGFRREDFRSFWPRLRSLFSGPPR